MLMAVTYESAFEPTRCSRDACMRISLTAVVFSRFLVSLQASRVYFMSITYLSKQEENFPAYGG